MPNCLCDGASGLIWIGCHSFCHRIDNEFDILWSTNLQDYLQLMRTASRVQAFYRENPGAPDPVLQLQRE